MLKTFRATDANNHLICANLFIWWICCQKQASGFIKGKQRWLTELSEPSASLFVLHTLPVFEVFTCNCLHGSKQHKFLSSPQPARPLFTCLAQSTHTPVQSQPNTFPGPLVWPHTFVPPLVQPRKSQNCILAVGTQRTEPPLNHRRLNISLFCLSTS